MTRHEIDIGDRVECDFCSTVYSGQPDVYGGLLFGSKGACPECAPRIEMDAVRFGEEHFIRARCPEGMSFVAWVLALRRQHPLGNKVVFLTDEDALDSIKSTRKP